MNRTLGLVAIAVVTLGVSTADAAQTNLVVAGPPAVAVNVPFNVDVTLTNSFGLPITTATDRVYLTVNGVGAGNLALRNGTVRFVGVRASRTPVTVTASCPTRYLTKTITIAGGGVPPSITSGSFTNFTEGTQGSFVFTTIGTPAPRVTLGAPPGVPGLPSGVTYVDNGNGTGMLAGTPALGTAGTYTLTVTASNGVGTNATQTFTLTVNPAGPPSREIRYSLVGSTPGSRRLVITWNNLAFYPGSPETGTFQAILFEGTNQIVFQYLRMEGNQSDLNFNEDLPATIGINQGDGVRSFSIPEGLVNPPGVVTTNRRIEFNPDGSGSYTVTGVLPATWDPSADVGSLGSFEAAPQEDDMTGVNILPGTFTFTFFGGAPITSLQVTTNGYITFDPTTSGPFTADFTPEPFPILGGSGRPHIAVFWDDLWGLPDQGGGE